MLDLPLIPREKIIHTSGLPTEIFITTPPDYKYFYSNSKYEKGLNLSINVKYDYLTDYNKYRSHSIIRFNEINVGVYFILKIDSLVSFEFIIVYIL